MSLAEIQVNIDQEAVRKYINEKLDQTMQQSLFFWDINRMSKMMSLSKSTLENEFLHHPKMKLLERRKEKGKRIWPVAESLEVMKRIMDQEW